MDIVTGASGHLGSNLVRALLAQGRQVRALVRTDCRSLEGLEVECVRGELDDPDSLRRAFQGVEVVYHSAAFISLLWDDWPRLEATNVQGVQNVVEACQATGARRLVHFSSIHALTQEPFDRPVDEDRPLVSSPRVPPYDRSKAAGERIVRRAIEEGLDAVILYPTGIIGPYDFKPSHFGEVLLALARGRMLALIEAGFDWVDARDVAEGALRAASHAASGSRYLLSGHWARVREVAAIIEAYTGRRAPRLVFPLGLAYCGLPFSKLISAPGGRPLFTSVSLHALRGNRSASHERAERELGFRPRPVEETIIDTLKWFEEVGSYQGNRRGRAGIR
jgi:dihydroflavonol-4-reductase